MDFNKIKMEQLIQYVWRHKLFPLQELRTTAGQAVEVIDPGLYNTNAGPDFFNAKVKIGGTLWVGNVEVHARASDWYRHGHDKDKAYDSVILHVAEVVDAEVSRSSGEVIPQLQLACPERIRHHFDELFQSDRYPRCKDIVRSLPRLMVHSWKMLSSSRWPATLVSG